MVLGNCGAGKTTFAHELAKLTGLELIHLDQHYWKPGWREPSPEAWKATLKRLVEKDAWIIEGIYVEELDIQLARADMAIFIDQSKWTSVWRVVKRWVTYAGEVRPEMPEGCEEEWDWDFLTYVYNFNEEDRPIVFEQLAEANLTFGTHIIETEADMKQFLKAYAYDF